MTATAPPPKPMTTEEKTSRSESEKIDVATCDIIFIDEQIRKKLSGNITTIKDLEKDLKNLLWVISYSTDPIDQINARNRTRLVRQRIQDIEWGFELALYVLRTSDILSEYKDIIDKTHVNSFVQTGTTRDEVKIHRKNRLILDYLRIAKEYIALENFHQKVQKTVCESCHGTSFSSDEDEATLICKCGNTIELLDDAPTFKDSERVNMSSRYTYTCQGHFIEAMNKFEGKQNTKIDESVIKTLRTELSLHSLTKATVSKDHLYMFLSEKKLSDYYADINLIYFLISGTNPPDITEFRNELLEMFNQLEEAYQEVKDDDRLNSLNVNWKLYKLLQLLDYVCGKDDFFCLKTPTKQGEHEEKWYDMIEYLKKKYPNAMTSYGKKRWRHIRTL